MTRIFKDIFGNTACITRRLGFPHRDAKNKIYGYKLTLSADYNGGDVYFVTIYPSEEDALRQLRKFSCNTWQEQTKRQFQTIKRKAVNIMSVNWGYFDKFEWANEKYLPRWGEGETKATQIVTAISQLVYRWYNDGDVFDNSYLLDGWCDYLPSCANWLEQHTTDEVSPILHRISECYTAVSYTHLTLPTIA